MSGQKKDMDCGYINLLENSNVSDPYSLNPDPDQGLLPGMTKFVFFILKNRHTRYVFVNPAKDFQALQT
jgi:hypothetical protein